MSESPEVHMARQDERLKNIQEMLQQDRQDKKELSSQVAQMFQILSNIENRVKTLEEREDRNIEMYEEFFALKNEVAGAKKVVRGLWFTISGLIALGLSIKAELVDWLSK